MSLRNSSRPSCWLKLSSSITPTQIEPNRLSSAQKKTTKRFVESTRNDFATAESRGVCWEYLSVTVRGVFPHYSISRLHRRRSKELARNEKCLQLNYTTFVVCDGRTDGSKQVP